MNTKKKRANGKREEEKEELAGNEAKQASLR